MLGRRLRRRGAARRLGPVSPIHARRAPDVSRPSAAPLSHDDAGPSVIIRLPHRCRRYCGPPSRPGIATTPVTISDAGPRGRARPLRQPARPAARDAAQSACRRPALRRPSPRRIRGRLPLPRRPHARRHELARRARPAAGGDHPQNGRRRQSHDARRADPAGPRLDPPNGPAARPRHHDVLVTALQAPRPLVLDAFQSAPLH